jgi:hypothetical protein
MFRTSLLSIGFASLVAACGSTTNTTVVQTAPNANGVFPANGFAGRDLRVEVSGDATTFDSATTVSFGAGVTVNSVTVASPTDLFADITIDPTAASGQNDVVITDAADGMLTLTKAFEIDTPGEATFNGTLAQGSVIAFSIKNHDVENPFDATQSQDPLTGQISFPNLALDTPAGVNAVVQAADPFSVSGLLLVDIDADASSNPISVVSGPQGGNTVTSAAGSLTIAARSATTLEPGTAANGSISAVLGSDLYKLDTGTSVRTLLNLTTQDQASPEYVLMDSTGHFSNIVDINVTDEQLSDTSQSFFLVVFDLSGTASYSYSLTADNTALTSVAQAADNTTAAKAQAVAVLPGMVTGGVLASDTDTHFYKVTITQADVGKSIHVITSGDPQTDTLVDVFGPNAATTKFGESDDLGFQENFTSNAIVSPGTYFVEVSASQAGFFDVAHNTYFVGILVE